MLYFRQFSLTIHNNKTVWLVVLNEIVTMLRHKGYVRKPTLY
jgi:hypothetical protein